MSDETTTWSEACKKVGFGDGLYQTCRNKVKGFDGLANSAYDDDFDEQLTGSALSIPEPPPGGFPQQREGLFGPSAVREDEGGGLLGDMPIEKVLLYGGLAALVWFFVLKKAQPVAATEDAPAATTPVTDDKAA